MEAAADAVVSYKVLYAEEAILYFMLNNINIVLDNRVAMFSLWRSRRSAFITMHIHIPEVILYIGGIILKERLRLW